MKETELDNGISIYEISGGEQEVIKIDISFFAGRPYEKTKLAAKIMASLLKDGTSTMTSKEIALFFDKYGATLSTSTGMDTVLITLYSLTKHLDKLLPLLVSIIQDSIFTKKEFDKLIIRSKEQLLFDLEKNDIVAYRELTKNIFGNEHSYGYNSDASLYDTIEVDDIRNHYNDTIRGAKCKVFVSGKISNANSELIYKEFGKIKTKELQPRNSIISKVSIPQIVDYPSQNQYQTAIRLGKKMFSRKHEDFADVFFVSTLLGGYFGSRLMSNIREDKGYTYGIYSTIDSMINDGYFMISTEVAKEFVEPTIMEIRKEIDRLKNELVPDEEIKIVKNYLFGSFLRIVDGPFGVAKIARTYINSGMSLSELESLYNKIDKITPEQVRKISNKYLDVDSMWMIKVG